MSTALITGASSGIGRELAAVFAANGHDLVLVARRESKLKVLARSLGKRHGIEATVIAMDLATAEAPGELFEAVTAQDLEIDILVNNAGRALGGRFARTEPSRLTGMMMLNAVTPMALARLFVEPMVDRGSGRIMNVASVAAFQPVPSLALYAATKSFLLHLSESLAEELRGTGVTVTAFCPGFTDTEMLEQAEKKSGRNELFHTLLVMPAEQVAGTGYQACMRGEAVAVPGLTYRMIAGLAQVPPRWFVRRAVGSIWRAAGG